MQSFTFNKKENILIPEVNNFKPLTDKDGKPIVGDKMILGMANVIRKWEEKRKRPVPIPDQKFLAWVLQTAKAISNGESSEEIFQKTLVPFH